MIFVVGVFDMTVSMPRKYFNSSFLNSDFQGSLQLTLRLHLMV